MRTRVRFGIGISVAAWAVAVLAAPLSDIGDDAHREEILALRERGIIAGYADGTFRPASPVNRAELLKILVTSLGVSPDPARYRDCFPDVSGAWFAASVCFAKEQGWIGGYDDGTFRPERTVNGAEALKILVNAYGYRAMQTSSASPYADVDPSAWYAPYVLLARGAGLLDREDGTLGVGEDMTRGRLSGMVYRALARREAGSAHAAAAASSPKPASRPASSAPSPARSLPSASRRRGGGGGGGNPTDGGGGSNAVVLASPTITFGALAKNYGDAAFALSPVSNSAGGFSFVSGNPAVATISGNTVTVVGAGTAVITATQAADGGFAAGSADATLTVSPIAPTLGGFGNVTKQMGDIPFTLTAPTSNSAGAFSYVSSNTGVATIAGSTVTLVSNGSTTITATQAAAGNYSAGVRTLTLTVVIGACITGPCLNGGICENGPAGTYSCTCAEHYSGTDCEMDDLNCYVGSGFECLNGGTCTATPAHGECSCAACYMGVQCDQYDSLNCA